MAVNTGCNAKIIVKATGPSDPAILISELNSWSISYSVPAREFRPLGAYYPTRGTSRADWSLSVSGYFDNLDPGQNEMIAGEERYFEIYPMGDAEPITDPIMSGICYIDSSDTSGTPDDLLNLKISATGSSTLVAVNTFIGEQP